MVVDNNYITFKAGLPGLPAELKKFQLLATEENAPFYWLQSLQDEEICLMIIDPFPFFADYQFKLPEEEKTKLKLAEDSEIAVFSIVNASRGLEKATVNLKAPVVVNVKERLARQIILSDKRYHIRQPLPLKNNNGEG